ncbi:MAG TPA: hypothetical protein VFR91_09555 [Dyella sp.]|nr:hypothetical protein [Dyella sp.]
MSSGPATLRTLAAVPDRGDLATGVELASAQTHGRAASSWRLYLQQLDAGVHPAHGHASDTLLSPLDAPLMIGDPAARPLLRLQVAHATAGQSLHIAEPTRIVRLERDRPDDVELIARPLQGPMLLPTAGQGWLAWLLTGHAEVRLGEAGWELPANAPAWLPAEADRRLRLEGGGEVLLVRFRMLPAV